MAGSVPGRSWECPSGAPRPGQGPDYLSFLADPMVCISRWLDSGTGGREPRGLYSTKVPYRLHHMPSSSSSGRCEAFGEPELLGEPAALLCLFQGSFPVLERIDTFRTGQAHYRRGPLKHNLCTAFITKKLCMDLCTKINM